MKLTRKQLKQIVQEAAAEYVWGVKNPSRVANQYAIKELSMKLSKLKKIIKEEIEAVIKEWERGTTLVPERPAEEGEPTQFGEYGEFKGEGATLQQIIQALRDAGLKDAADHLENEFGKGIERWEFPSKYGE